jgi:hypothetical protein
VALIFALGGWESNQIKNKPAAEPSILIL